jgi:hypothetical protein
VPNVTGKNVPVDFLDRKPDGTLASNDYTIGQLIRLLAEAGLQQARGYPQNAETIYQTVIDNAHKADQGRRDKKE